MKKTFTTALAGAVLASVTACQGGGAPGGMKLIPEQATIVIGVDIGGLLKTKAYQDNKAMIESGEAKEMMEAMKGCNLNPESLGTILIGTDGKDPKPNVTAVFTGAGIGDEKNLTCISDKAKEKTGEAPFTIADEGGKKVLKMKDDDGVGYIVDAKTVVIATKDWAGATKELIEGKGKSAADGANKDLFGRADQKKHVWFAGVLPEAALAGLKGSPAEGLKDFSGSLDLSSGLAFTVTAGATDADKAKAMKDQIDQQWPLAKGMAGMFGIPQPVVDSVKFDLSGSAISVSATITEADMKAIQDQAGKMLGGGMGGGMGGDMGAPPVEAPPADAPPTEGGAPAEAAPAE